MHAKEINKDRYILNRHDEKKQNVIGGDTHEWNQDMEWREPPPTPSFLPPPSPHVGDNFDDFCEKHNQGVSISNYILKRNNLSKRKQKKNTSKSVFKKIFFLE